MAETSKAYELMSDLRAVKTRIGNIEEKIAQLRQEQAPMVEEMRTRIYDLKDLAKQEDCGLDLLSRFLITYHHKLPEDDLFYGRLTAQFEEAQKGLPIMVARHDTIKNPSLPMYHANMAQGFGEEHGALPPPPETVQRVRLTLANAPNYSLDFDKALLRFDSKSHLSGDFIREESPFFVWHDVPRPLTLELRELTDIMTLFEHKFSDMKQDEVPDWMKDIFKLRIYIGEEALEELDEFRQSKILKKADCDLAYKVLTGERL